VYHCLSRSYAGLDVGCQKELSRALHMAFHVWRPAQLLTSACDVDAQASTNFRRLIALGPKSWGMHRARATSMLRSLAVTAVAGELWSDGGCT
jgi:hypothetical protein